MKPTPGAGELLTALHADYDETCRELGRMLGTEFTLSHQGGGCMAVVGIVGGVRIHISDYAEGDLSPACDRRGYWVGFYYPDSPWTGQPESIVGDRDCRIDDLDKLVCFALSAFLRGERHQSEVVEVVSHEVVVHTPDYRGSLFG